MNVLAQMTCGQGWMALLLILVCCFLMIVILLQRGRGGGLAGAFGGAGGGGGAFGAKTGDVFTWITVVVATVFVVLAVVGGFVFDQSSTPSATAAPATTTPTTPQPQSSGESLPIKVTPVPVETPGAATEGAEVPPGTSEAEAEGGEGGEKQGSAPAPDATTTAPTGDVPTDSEPPTGEDEGPPNR